MRIVNNYQSIVTMDKIYFDRLEFQREKEILSDELSVKFEKSVDAMEGNNKYRVILQCTIEDKKYNSLRIFASMVGIFECHSEDTGLLNTLINENTIAIMFPFLRSQISLLTTQPDMSPVILPPMNINSLLSELDSQNKS